MQNQPFYYFTPQGQLFYTFSPNEITHQPIAVSSPISFSSKMALPINAFSLPLTSLPLPDVHSFVHQSICSFKGLHMNQSIDHHLPVQPAISPQISYSQQINHSSGPLGSNLRSFQQEVTAQDKRKRKTKMNSDDGDYKPYARIRKHKKQKTSVDQARNIIPIEISQLLSFIQRYAKSGQLIQQIFSKYPHSPLFTITRFYQYQQQLKDKLCHYNNQKCLSMLNELYEPKCESWPEQEQWFYIKMTRILIHHFLHQDSIPIILTSRRMKQSKKSHHLRARRILRDLVYLALK